MTDPAADLVVCRQRLDVLERQARAATPFTWVVDREHVAAQGWRVMSEGHVVAWTGSQYDDPDCEPDAEHIAAWSPAAVLALCGWIRQTLDDCESDLGLARYRRLQLNAAERLSLDRARAHVAGLAAVLAEQAVK